MKAVQEPDVLIKSNFDIEQWNKNYESPKKLNEIYNPYNRIEKVNDGKPTLELNVPIENSNKKSVYELPVIKRNLSFAHKKTSSQGDMRVFVKQQISQINLSTMDKKSKKNVLLNLKKAKRLKDKIKFQKDCVNRLDIA